LLRACKKRGLRVVLARSADEREFAVLRAALDAEDSIDEATPSADVEHSKPAADLVQVALDRRTAPRPRMSLQSRPPASCGNALSTTRATM